MKTLTLNYTPPKNAKALVVEIEEKLINKGAFEVAINNGEQYKIIDIFSTVKVGDEFITNDPEPYVIKIVDPLSNFPVFKATKVETKKLWDLEEKEYSLLVAKDITGYYNSTHLNNYKYDEVVELLGEDFYNSNPYIFLIHFEEIK